MRRPSNHFSEIDYRPELTTYQDKVRTLFESFCLFSVSERHPSSLLWFSYVLVHISAVIIFVVVIHLAVVVLIAVCTSKLALVIVILLNVHLDGLEANIGNPAKGVGQKLSLGGSLLKEKQFQEKNAD